MFLYIGTDIECCVKEETRNKSLENSMYNIMNNETLQLSMLLNSEAYYSVTVNGFE